MQLLEGPVAAVLDIDHRGMQTGTVCRKIGMQIALSAILLPNVSRCVSLKSNFESVLSLLNVARMDSCPDGSSQDLHAHSRCHHGQRDQLVW